MRVRGFDVGGNKSKVELSKSDIGDEKLMLKDLFKTITSFTVIDPLLAPRIAKFQENL